VFLAERLAARIATRWPQVAVRHSTLPDAVKVLPAPPIAPVEAAAAIAPAAAAARNSAKTS
jgi:hypothetical protein